MCLRSVYVKGDLSMVTRRTLLKGAAGTAALAVTGIPTLKSAGAQDGPPLPENCEVLASGLMAPRYIAVGDDGSIYVTEAGIGGDEPVYSGLDEDVATPGAGTPVAGTPTAAEPDATRGNSGQITKIAPDGTVSVAATGLPSYLIGGLEATGPSGIVLAGGLIWVSVGGPGPGTGSMTPIPMENSVVSIDEATGEMTLIADIGAYEIANNPDPNAIDSNVYGMALATDGMLYVADAGGNAVYKVDPGTSEFSVASVIPGIPIPAEAAPPGGNPARGGALEIDPVPTGIGANPDGGVYVSLLSGGPFPTGAAKIHGLAEDGTLTDAAMGLTMCTDVKVGPDGNLYAVQISLDFLAETPGPGNVVRIGADGTLEPVVEGLMLPNSIAFDAEGNLLIAIGAVTPPGSPPVGALLRCTGVIA